MTDGGETLNVQPGAVYFALRTMGLDGCSTIAVRHERREVEGVVYALTQWLRT